MAVVHRTYANALFQVAKEQKRLDAVRADFAEFVEAAKTVPELRNLLLNPELDPRAKSAALGEILEGADELVCACSPRRAVRASSRRSPSSSSASSRASRAVSRSS